MMFITIYVKRMNENIHRCSGVTCSNMDLASSVDKSGSLNRYGACFGMSRMLVSRPWGFDILQLLR